MQAASKGSIWKNYSGTIILLGAIVAGTLVGIFLPTAALSLKPVGDIFLNLIFTSVVPLIFFAVASSVIQLQGKEKAGRILLLTGLVYTVTALLAAAFAILVLEIFPLSPVEAQTSLAHEEIAPSDISSTLVRAFTVNDFSALLSKQNMLALIVFSLLTGFAVRISGEKGTPFQQFIFSGNEVMKNFLHLIMKIAPLGLGAYFAYLIASLGPQLLQAYVESTILYYSSSLVYFLGAFSLYAFFAGGFRGIKNYWKNNITPSLTALATCSSIATMPVNLEAGEKMSIRPSVNKLAIPLGAALHKEGSSLGAIIKIAVLFAILGKPFSGTETLMLALFVALLTSIVEGGIPNGGYIGEVFIITAYGFPPEFLPVVTVIATVIDPMATLLNATGDTASTMVISRIYGKNVPHEPTD
ncbi:Na+/H+-dicarboxylate symporter [Anseongella ginsenosidimutans]|uniref:Na+/H+-dicarboxylate symporter n=1 Tax=Anseongella ginsenosidimutans TaxID=496056 RepID=A0A4R3KU57_9SPHI|nr:dicarboxylate/amino acid:cation symporter [Anseongella ginsenosidimutans]QEC51580.1 dicarboxylate/amino acid:cation symporter [Anseongella ginsenosidimutans]TCS88907.1 Na+/H+-dicarboxylate symporter [Anseongella ginsenosidimutans]